MPTSVGPELYVVRGTFNGRLDERSIAALVEARSTPDVFVLAKRIAPVGEWTRASGTLWRSEAEAVGNEDAITAYQATPIGTLSGPFVLEGEIVLLLPEERSSSTPDEATLARLDVRGFEAWLSGEIVSAEVIRDPEPLPGVIVESPTPGVAVDPSRDTIATPFLPQLPIP